MSLSDGVIEKLLNNEWVKSPILRIMNVEMADARFGCTEPFVGGDDDAWDIGGNMRVNASR